MKTLAISTSLLTISLLAASAAEAKDPATAWNLDTAHTDVSFKVRHLAVSYTRGRFKAVSGTLDLDQKDVTKSKVDITIDIASIDTGNQQRDDHLRSADFFEVEKHPTMKFASTRVRKQKDGLRIDGALTMHGVTRPVILEVEALGAAIVGPYGFERRGFTATAKVDRRAFGLTWSKTLESGGLVVGHDVFITIEAEFKRKPAGGDA